MKKITAILFLSIFLFSTTGFNELLKINVLVRHFHETQKNDSLVTFFHFLVMHYVTDDLNDKDNERDKQLPFKSTETGISNDYLICVSGQNMRFEFQFFAINKNNFFPVKNLFISPNYRSFVWHPPKYS